MKAITLHQPWASLMAAGIKTIETRSWATSYRGPLAIHAGNTLVYDHKLWDLLKRDDTEELPHGAVLCIVELIEVVPTETIHGLSGEEYQCGNFADGRFAWKTQLVEVLNPPIACRGHQRLWNWNRPGR